jgi:hypothetical protein
MSELHLSPLVFNSMTYPKNHWFVKQHDMDFTDPHLVCFAHYVVNLKMYTYRVMINPTDARGYRMIVALHRTPNGDDVQYYANRKYSEQEEVGLSIVSTVVKRCFSSRVLVSHLCILGNRSHTFDPKTRTTTIGNEKEPGCLHAHIVWRGNPECEYITGVPLGGPEPGEVFGFMGTNTNVPGNENKLKWTDATRKNVRIAFQSELRQMNITSVELVFK